MERISDLQPKNFIRPYKRLPFDQQELFKCKQNNGKSKGGNESGVSNGDKKVRKVVYTPLKKGIAR